jgi:hypothetical protein
LALAKYMMFNAKAHGEIIAVCFLRGLVKKLPGNLRLCVCYFGCPIKIGRILFLFEKLVGANSAVV